jgi:hypothetical protein
MRGNDYVDAKFRFEDDAGRHLRFGSELIRLDDFKVLYDGLKAEYDEVIATEIFFGLPIPSEFFPDMDISSFIDDPGNRAAGFSFLDDPRNNLIDRTTIYGQWVLSTPSVQTRLANIAADGTVTWKGAACAILLRSFVKLRLISCARNIISAGPSIRATEIGRDLLRNLPGASMRSVLILYKNLTIVGMQDKSTHRNNKKTYTPKTPNTETSVAFIHELVLFRRFEANLIHYFFGDAEAERYRLYLWPAIKRNIFGDEISDRLGEATLKYLKVKLKIRDYRHAISEFLRFHGDETYQGLAEDTYADLAQNHSSRTAYQRYGVDRAGLARSDPRLVVGCIKASIRWQQITGIQGERPVTVSLRGPLPRYLIPDVAAQDPENDLDGADTGLSNSFFFFPTRYAHLRLQKPCQPLRSSTQSMSRLIDVPPKMLRQ